MKYLLDQTKVYRGVLSQVDHEYQKINITEEDFYEEGESSSDESDSSLDIFDKSCTVSSDKVSMANYGSYFTEVILLVYYLYS